jgi:hypothetical protein
MGMTALPDFFGPRSLGIARRDVATSRVIVGRVTDDTQRQVAAGRDDSR